MEANAHSRANLAYTYAIHKMVKSMLSFDISADDILLIIFYAARQRCYVRLFKALGINIMIKSVNASQGKEKPLVTLKEITRFSL